MGRKCSICEHSQADTINKELISGTPFRNIAEQFQVSTTSLHNHKSKHLPADLVKAQDAHEVARADSLLVHVQELQQKALSLLDKAETAGDLKTALAGVREARSCIELLARLQGELESGEVVRIQVLIPQIQQIILDEVHDPQTLERLSGRFEELEKKW